MGPVLIKPDSMLLAISFIQVLIGVGMLTTAASTGWSESQTAAQARSMRALRRSDLLRADVWVGLGARLENDVQPQRTGQAHPRTSEKLDSLRRSLFRVSRFDQLPRTECLMIATIAVRCKCIANVTIGSS